jgi:hypothetical protein
MFLSGAGIQTHTADRLAIMNIQRAVMFLVIAAGALAGCSGFGQNQQTAAPDPNVFPANYRSTLVTFLRRSLTDRSDFRDVTISEPALKPVGPNQHYLVCVQFDPRGQTNTTKAAVYLSGQMSQFIDATPEQCADAVYRPFKELEAAAPPTILPSDLSDPRGMH